MDTKECLSSTIKKRTNWSPSSEISTTPLTSSPPERYFLTRLLNMLKGGNKWVPQRLLYWHRQELQLRIKKWVTENGFSINNIVFTAPTATLWSNTCKYGIGCYNNKGLEWRCYIPTELQGVFTPNLIEFLASATSIYLTIQQLGPGPHILYFTESSSDLRWMYTASFDSLK